MTIIAMPSDLKVGLDSGMGQKRFDLAGGSETTGADQVRMMGPPRWTMALVQPQYLNLVEAGVWQALITGLRGRVNVLEAWDPFRPVPRGTLRGTPTLIGTHPAGQAFLYLSAVPDTTVLRGDWLQLGTGLGTSQLVMVKGDSRTDVGGALAFPIEPPLRVAVAGGTAVTWDKPKGYFRQTSDSSSWRYKAGGLMATGMSIDLLETWS